MKMNRLALVLLLPLFASPVLAADSPWYVGASVGNNWLSDGDIPRTTYLNGAPTHLTDANADFDRRSTYSAVLGYRFSDAWSVEGEFAHRTNKTDRLSAAGVSSASMALEQVELRSNSVMANARYSFPGLGPLRPYVGAGVGASEVRMKWTRRPPANGAGAISDDNWAFAYQAQVGLDLELAKHWTLNAQYQYFRVGSPDVSTNRRVTAITSQTWEVNDYKAQTLSIGLRYAF